MDELTGLFNRRHFMELCAREIDRARRYDRPCSFVIMDLDNFKQVNDTYGHQAGDMVLEYAAALCSDTLRQCDIFGRYGGEEFAILLPETSPDSAMLISRRLRDALAGSPLLIGDKEITITASFGVTGAERIDAEVNMDSLIAGANTALYRAKAGGRNRVEQA